MFDEVGLVQVSHGVDHWLMVTRPGKGFVRECVHRYVVRDWDPVGSGTQTPARIGSGWWYIACPIPESLKDRCPALELWIASDPEGSLVVLFPSERNEWLA